MINRRLFSLKQIKNMGESYQKILILFPDIWNLKTGSAKKLKSGGLMDLHLDILGRETDRMSIALHHSYELNGELVSDPDMEVRLDKSEQSGIAIPLSFQNIYRYDRVFDQESKQWKPKLLDSLNDFLNLWLNNCIGSHYQ